MSEHENTIDALMAENRTFPPPDWFKDEALVVGTFLYDEAAQDDEGFWARQAADLVQWSQPWDTILDWQLPFAKWFVGGKLNVSENCLDRHVAAGHGDKVAFHWEGEPGDTRTITYAELLDEVQRFANVLKDLGVEQGRSGQHLHADDPRGGGGDARLRPHRRPAQRRVRRLLGAVAGRPDQRCRGQGAGDRRRRLPPWRGVPAQAGRRRGGGADVDDRARRGRQARRQRRRRWSRAATTGTTTSCARPRPIARPSRWTPRTCCSCSTPRARPASRRGSCTRWVATSPTSPTPTGTCSTSIPRPTCSGAPPTSAG